MNEHAELNSLDSLAEPDVQKDNQVPNQDAKTKM